MTYETNSGKIENNLILYRPYRGPIRITSKFGRRWGVMHKGCDYVGQNKEIFSIGHARVIRKSYQRLGAGNYIVCQSLWYRAYIEIKYFHLSKTLVEIGDELFPNMQIGVEGNTGHSFGSHLHLEIWVNGKVIDPETVIWLDRR